MRPAVQPSLRRCNLAGFNDNIMDFRLRIASPLTVPWHAFIVKKDRLVLDVLSNYSWDPQTIEKSYP